MATATIAELRQRFREQCERTEGQFQNFQIRVHRALSWFERAIELDEDQQPDGRLLYCWIAFNSLYGSWEREEGFPAKDTASWKAFLDTAIAIDQHDKIPSLLQDHRDDVLWLLENKYLDPRFWKNPQRPGNTRARYHQAQSLYFEGRWAVILDYVIERVYVLRGQIAHGAATRGSQLNREALTRCRQLLEAIIPITLELVIEHRADDSWPPLCYPPMWDK